MHRGLSVAVVAAALAGCIEPSLVQCADGRACPNGQRCDDVHHSCVSPDQFAACDGAVDLAPCHTSLIPDGVCFGGICLPAGCGNAELEPNELCDDGNLVSGDGCSADCRSREVCGDGFVDVTLGEQCDDGGTLGRDGCTAGCVVEQMTWRSQSATAPALRSGSAIVYDPIRRVVVMFGGQDNLGLPSDVADTWEWNGTQWREVTPLTSPPARHGHALAYDPRRHRIVMFGGSSVMFGELNDTWEYDGATWQSHASAIGPSAREGVSMVWDHALGRILMFGGKDGTTRFADTWTWDGAVWTQLAPPAAPTARSNAGVVYDVARGRSLLFGGATDTDVLTDTWAFDGVTWSPVAAALPPSNPIVATPAVVYDPIHGVPLALVVTTTPTAEEVWALSGANWQPLTTAANAFGLGSTTSFAFDIARGRVINWSNNVREYEYGVGWSVATIAPDPSPRVTQLAYDSGRARVVMFGSVAETWEWDGTQWTNRMATGPGVRGQHVMAYDGVSKRVLLFGGNTPGPTAWNDTWGWDGTTWADVTPATGSPSKRALSAMTYDSDRHRVVLFGGVDASGLVLADTWEWDGAAWSDVTPLAPASSPPAIGFCSSGSCWGTPAMTYDPGRRRTVLFGRDPGETWEWDGTTWTAHPSDVLPAARWLPALMYDVAHARVVLSGGSFSSSQQWEWDGNQWRQPEIASIAPTAMMGVAGVYDEARREIVTFGGNNGFGGLGHTVWLGSYRGPDDEVCDSGVDVDRDGKIGCADEDCAGACAHCGDGTCNGVENDRLCPVDCPATPPICGDAYCAPAESAATCAADCTP